MFTQSSSVDENALASKAQSRGRKGPFVSKSLTINSNRPKTPSVQSNHALQRRALGDISNRKVQQDIPKTVDRKTEKKPTTLNTTPKATQTPFSNHKGLQETKTNQAVQQKTANFVDLPYAISIKHNKIDKSESSNPAQKHHDVDDDNEIERPAGRTWLEQRAFIDDSSYLSDDSLEFVNGHKIAMDNHRYLIEKGRKEHDEERKKLLAAYDKKMELLEQRLYGGDFDESFYGSSFDKDGLSLDKVESILVFEDDRDDWSRPSLPTDDLSDAFSLD